MMIIQDENRLKEEEEEQEQQEVEEEQESSRMSTEMNSTVKAAVAEEDVHDLSVSNGKKTVSPDLGKSANRRKQVKPNRVTNDEDGIIQRELIIDESNGNDHRSSLDEEISNHSSQPQLPSVPATQQQEAYCNLCERSFCNKYFLKTHLAKKHGVLNMVSPLSSADNHDNGHVAFSPPVSSSSCLSTESPAVPLIVQPPTPAMAPKSLEKFGEDYCEICQKRFCNKYYLRKHKGECHGIYTDYIKSLQKSAHDSPMKTSASRRPSSTTSSISIPSNTSNTLLLNPFYPGPSDMKSLYPISSSTSPLINDSPPLAQKQSSQRSSRRCHLCEKEFRTKSLLRTHISTVHANGKLLPSTPLHPATNLSFLQPFLDSTSQLAQKVITGQTPQTSYGLVPDAYFCAKMADRVVCEICNKQVCNKYFLKTHKAKVHGITQSELQEPSHDNSNRENSDTFCTLCKKDFSTKYFYLLHMHTMHQETNDATYQTFIEFLKTASNLDPSANLPQPTDDDDEDDEADGDTTDRSSRKRSHSSTDSAGAKRLHSLTEMNNGGLQPFLLESEDPSFSQTFVPCMVYLPVLRRVTKQVKINLRLKPVLGDTST